MTTVNTHQYDDTQFKFDLKPVKLVNRWKMWAKLNFMENAFYF